MKYLTIQWYYKEILIMNRIFSIKESTFKIPVVMGPGQKFLTRVGSAIYGLGLNLENFP